MTVHAFILVCASDLKDEGGFTEEGKASSLVGYRGCLDGNVIDAREMIF